MLTVREWCVWTWSYSIHLNHVSTSMNITQQCSMLFELFQALKLQINASWVVKLTFREASLQNTPKIYWRWEQNIWSLFLNGRLLEGHREFSQPLLMVFEISSWYSKAISYNFDAVQIWKTAFFFPQRFYNIQSG